MKKILIPFVGLAFILSLGATVISPTLNSTEQIVPTDTEYAAGTTEATLAAAGDSAWSEAIHLANGEHFSLFVWTNGTTVALEIVEYQTYSVQTSPAINDSLWTCLDADGDTLYASENVTVDGLSIIPLFPRYAPQHKYLFRATAGAADFNVRAWIVGRGQ